MTKSTLNYVTVVAAREEEPPGTRHTAWGCWYPGQGEDGYGKKISSRYMVKVSGDNRWYRVYATCFSNCASHWILRGGRCFHLENDEEVTTMAAEWEKKNKPKGGAASTTTSVS